MRYAVISDIHANLHALEAVLEDIESRAVETLVCLGDIVGYGAYPEECVQRVRSLGCLTVAGNHDYAALDKISIEHFNPLARAATLWTRDNLSESAREFLDSIGLVEELPDASFVHGSYHSPELFDYVQTSYDAFLSLSKMPRRICFIGHSHVPVTFQQNPTITFTLEENIDVPADGKTLVNVGSVGQPRDQNPRASYAVYDDDEARVWICRVPYDIEGAAAGISDKGLPSALGERLKVGR